MLMQELPTNLTGQFLKKHEDFHGIIMLYAMGWEEDFGDEIVVEVVESNEEKQLRVPLYEAAGYVLKDENAFGDANGIVGIACCYQKK